MNHTHDLLDGLSGLIAGLHKENFESKLFQWVGKQVRIDNFTVLAYPGSGLPRALFSRSAIAQVHDHLESDYVSGAYLLDPFYTLHVDHAASGLYTLADVAPDQFMRTRYFAEYFERTTIVDELVFASRPTQETSVQISIGRDASSSRRFSRREIEVARGVAPVVCALCEKNWRDYSVGKAESDVSLHQSLRERLKKEEAIHLSPRQSEVALLILKGHSSLSISLRLGISEQTVKVFRKQLYRKCGISSQAELFTMMMPLLSGIALVQPSS